MIEAMIQEAQVIEAQKHSLAAFDGINVLHYTLRGELAFFLGEEAARSATRNGGCVDGLPALQFTVNNRKVWIAVDIRDDRKFFVIGDPCGAKCEVLIVHSEKEQTRHRLLVAIGQMAGL